MFYIIIIILYFSLNSATVTRYHTRDMVSVTCTITNPFEYCSFCSDTCELPSSLLQQLKIYHLKQEKDNSLADIPGGVDLNNHNDVYRVVFEKVYR